MPVRTHTVALIDDDESMCKALTRLLTASGFTVSSYFSAEAYLDQIDRARPEFLVVDVGLPGMSGIELAAHLHHHFPDTPPIAFMSALDDADVRSEAEQVGCVIFLNKPFLGQSLISAMHKAVDTP